MNQSKNPSFDDVRLRGFARRTSVAEVIELIDQRTAPLSAETVPLDEAADRVLAAEVVADVAVPGFDRAAMDGYAVRSADVATTPVQLVLVGVALPGRPFAGELTSGQAVRIMTGAPVPAGAECVVPVEQAQEAGEQVQLLEGVAPGRHISRRGEDIRAGEVVLPAGRRLRPQDVGLLSSIGVASPAVVRRPRVRVLITGEELLPPGSRPEGHRIVDSNSVQLAALIRRDGGIPEVTAPLPDRQAVLRAELLSSQADLLLIVGGSSVGQEDHAPSVLADVGELLIHGVAVRPAAPTGVGVVQQRLVMLLPGNPVSCLCAYDLFAGRAIRRLGGRSVDWPYRAVEATLARPIASVLGRLDYVRVRLQAGIAEPLTSSGASNLSTTTRADGFFLLPADREALSEGEQVQVWFYDVP